MFLATLLQRRLELPQDLLLFLGQSHRRFNGHVAIQVAGVAGPQPAYALTAQTECLAGLGALGNGDRTAPGQRGDFKFAAQRRCSERNGQLAMQVIALALEDAMLLEVNLDIQVARRPAIDARFAVAGRTDTHAVVDARRDLYLQSLIAADAAHAVAGRAGIRDLLAGTVTGRAILLNAKESLLHAHHPRAIAGVAGAWVGTRLGTVAMTDIAGFPARYPDLGVEAVGRLLQRNIQRVLEVGATIDLWPAAPTAGSTEDFTEDVAKRIGKSPGAAHASAHAGVRIHACMTVTVVGRPFLLVGQHFVSLFDFLELLFGFLAVRIAVRVVLHCQLAISLLELIVGGVLGYPQDLVVIAFCHLSCLRL